MTVREITTAMHGVKAFYIVWDGNDNPFDPNNAMYMQGFGDYVVRRVVLPEGDPTSVELELECYPVKEGRDTLCGAARTQ